MCRLFGFRSVIHSQVHQSLVRADNALMLQSSSHPDGWGVAWYLERVPHVLRSLNRAIDCKLFKKVSGLVRSETVLAHLRKATIGTLEVVNTHPFQYGPWTFAHNGNIKGFSSCRKSLHRQIDEPFRRHILGETDSEVIFFLIISHLYRLCPEIPDQNLEHLTRAVKDVRSLIIQEAGPLHPNDGGSPEENYLTFVMTNGTIMLALQGGKSLFYSTYKKKCSDREHCPWLSHECEHPVESKGKVNHLIFSSEPLEGENVWMPMPFGSMLAIDSDFVLGWY